MSQEGAVALVFGLAIVGGVFVIIAGMLHRAKVLEMMHRERLAMIERGLVPPSDLPIQYHDRPAMRSNRMLSGGIVIVGLGLGLAMLIGFASREPEIAVGVGGAVTILGAAFIVTALLVHGPKAETLSAREPRRSVERIPPPPTTPES